MLYEVITIPRPAADLPIPRGRLGVVDRAGRGADLPASRTRRGRTASADSRSYNFV